MEGVLERVRLAHLPVDSVAAKMRQYDGWCKNYDEDVTKLEYSAPKYSVDFFQEMVRENGYELSEESKILDFAAGSGLVGGHLRSSGCVCQIDAQDGSKGMLEVARKKKIYSNFYNCILDPQTDLPIPDSHYDAAFVVGALSENQVPFQCLQTMLRHIKVSGLMVFTTRSNKSNLRYLAAITDEISRLESKKIWKKVSVRDVEIFEKATSMDEVCESKKGPSLYIPGTLYCYRKL